MADETPSTIDENEIHGVFGLLREQVVDAAQGFHDRVDQELTRIQSARDADPGLIRVALSALLQTTNLVIEALSGAHDDDDGDDDDDDS